MTSLTNDEVKRLATLGGVSSFECWQSQIENANERMSCDLEGDFQAAFTRCLPIWVETGRVRDLSRRIQAPKYWPHYSSLLGDEFARKFKYNYPALIAMLENFALETREYLCLCDLIEAVMHEFSVNDDDVPSSIFQIQSTVPQVIQYEFAHKKEFIDCMTNLGCFLKCLYSHDYED